MLEHAQSNLISTCSTVSDPMESEEFTGASVARPLLPDDKAKEGEFKAPRASWNAYFMSLARAASTRSSCDRASVGAVIVKNKQVVSTGYNGSISGTAHCDDKDVGHLVIDGHCVRANHAEIGAITSAARRGVSTDDSVCYVSHFPCITCFRALCQAGVKRIVYREFKSNGMTSEVIQLMLDAPVELFTEKDQEFKWFVRKDDAGKLSVAIH